MSLGLKGLSPLGVFSEAYCNSRKKHFRFLRNIFGYTVISMKGVSVKFSPLFAL